MKLLPYNFIRTPLHLLVAVGLLVAPGIVSASIDISQTNRSSIESDIHVSSSGGTGTVEVTHTAIINGESSTYHFASTSADSIQHQVRIEPGVSIDTKDSTPVMFNPPLPPASSTPYGLDGELSEQNLMWLRKLINYLYAYVQHLI